MGLTKDNFPTEKYPAYANHLVTISRKNGQPQYLTEEVEKWFLEHDYITIEDRRCYFYSENDVLNEGIKRENYVRYHQKREFHYYYKYINGNCAEIKRIHKNNDEHFYELIAIADGSSMKDEKPTNVFVNFENNPVEVQFSKLIFSPDYRTSWRLFNNKQEFNPFFWDLVNQNTQNLNYIRFTCKLGTGDECLMSLESTLKTYPAVHDFVFKI
ncbi:MAG: hypothetical protein IPK08_06170 [Bacteroidetes bacterium]|nr:hypothetical protein [Bacteroidota bacterium]